MGRRTRYEIYSDILEMVLRRGASPLTRISYGAGLPVDRTKKALQFLVSRGLLKEENIGDIKVYRITKRGGEFLEALKTVRKFIQFTPEYYEAPQR
jgi:predicted transcriptional regulator